MATAQQVLSNITDVTPEQIGKCHKVFGSDNKAFYLVENEAGKLDENNQVIEYKVTYSPAVGFQCTCDSGYYGFWNVKHPSGVCKHVRWSVACSLEEKAAMATLTAETHTTPLHCLIINGKQADKETLDRVMNARAKAVHGNCKPRVIQPFSILR